MGREAVTRAEWQGEVAEVQALLESSEIILRGAIKARIPLASVRDAKVDGEDLILSAGPSRLVLSLGALEAGKWLTKLTSPPKTLAEKLGLSDGLARVSGDWESDVELAKALRGRIGEPARVAIAVVLSAGELDKAIAEAMTHRLPTWFVHPKGKAAVTDQMIREKLRALSWIDTKTSAVSGRLTSTRYQPRSGGS